MLDVVGCKWSVEGGGVIITTMAQVSTESVEIVTIEFDSESESKAFSAWIDQNEIYPIRILFGSWQKREWLCEPDHAEMITQYFQE